jgi:hypothetical protein
MQHGVTTFGQFRYIVEVQKIVLCKRETAVLQPLLDVGKIATDEIVKNSYFEIP